MEKIAQRLAEDAIATRIAFIVVGKARPDDLFAGTFYDIREKAKKLKNQWSDEAQGYLNKTLINDLNNKKVKVLDAKVSLGQYKGSKFVTSAKLQVQVKDRKAAEALLTYLQSKYSPKYKLKNFDEDNNIADYNVR